MNQRATSEGQAYHDVNLRPFPPLNANFIERFLDDRPGDNASPVAALGGNLVIGQTSTSFHPDQVSFDSFDISNQTHLTPLSTNGKSQALSP